jgi:hypothetical protein
MTKAEQSRLSRLKAMPCIACGELGVDVHHIVDKGYRKHSGGHMATIQLCPWCHRGQPAWGVPVSQMMLIVGPSLALNKREFVKRYGTERELLAKVNEILEGRKAA